MKHIIELCDQQGDIVLYDSTKESYVLFFKSLFLKSGLKNIKWERKMIKLDKSQSKSKMMRVVDITTLYKNFFEKEDYPNVKDVRDLLLQVYLLPDKHYDKLQDYRIDSLYPYLFLLYTKDISKIPISKTRFKDVTSIMKLYKYIKTIDPSIVKSSISMGAKRMLIEDVLKLMTEKGIDHKSTIHDTMVKSLVTKGLIGLDDQQTTILLGQEEYLKYLHTIGIASIPTRYGYKRTDGKMVYGAN